MTTTTDREAQIAAGTVLLTATEMAPRIGLSATVRGVRTVKEMAMRHAIPGVKIGKQYLFHWPTVVAKIGKAHR